MSVGLLRQQFFIGVFGLRILIHISCRRALEWSPDRSILLHVFAVIAFFTVQAEQALFQDPVAAVPKRQRKTKTLVAIADSGQPIFIPPIGARTGVLMRKIFPRIAVGAVVSRTVPQRVRLRMAPSFATERCGLAIA